MTPRGKFTRIFVTGCGGMLGEAVYREFSSVAEVRATDLVADEPWLTQCDVRDLQRCRALVDEFEPDLILHLAALTDLEYCERNPDESWSTHALGTENMALLAREVRVPLVYISTAGIFDGAQEFYNDYDPPNPLSIYAKSKYRGETLVESMLERYFVFRAGWMMGGGPARDKKFVNKIFRQIASGARTLEVVDDKLGTPTYTHDFAANMRRVVESDLYGLYNMVCEGSCSRLEVAREFVDLLGLADEITLKTVDSSRFAAEYFAPRPASEKLTNMKLQARGLNGMRDWKVCLADYAPVFREALATRSVGAVDSAG